jgi:hypothetical protein
MDYSQQKRLLNKMVLCSAIVRSFYQRNLIAVSRSSAASSVSQPVPASQRLLQTSHRFAF